MLSRILAPFNVRSVVSRGYSGISSKCHITSISYVCCDTLCSQFATRSLQHQPLLQCTDLLITFHLKMSKLNQPNVKVKYPPCTSRSGRTFFFSLLSPFPPSVSFELQTGETVDRLDRLAKKAEFIMEAIVWSS